MKEITDLVEHAKFVSQDLVEVFERVTKCFPPSYNIFELYQARYQKNIQEKIMPHMELLTEEKQYGNLLALMTWIEDYEAVLSRAGVSSTSYIELKLEVKKLMPLFIDHNQSLLRTYINNCVAKDSENFHRSFYEELLQNKSDFISNYPSDIFIFVNKEAEIIKEQVRGELFIEFVRVPPWLCSASPDNFEPSRLNSSKSSRRNTLRLSCVGSKTRSSTTSTSCC